MDNGASSYRRFRDDGDESGLVEIIRDYKDGLILYLTSFVGSVRLAEEIAEDTFVILGTKKPRDKGKSSFKTWLYTIGRNAAIDRMRREKRHATVSVDEIAELEDGESLEESYIRSERKIAVHRAMAKLGSEQRQILWLVYFEGMTVKEASSVMGKSVHAAEGLMYRAKKSLRSQLESEGMKE